MQLKEQQLNSYDSQGYFLLENCFSLTEIEAMKAELPQLYSNAETGRILEKDGATVRAFYGVHSYNSTFASLVKQARIAEPIQQILQSPVYVHQLHINTKKAFSGDCYLWHQDYAFHLREDKIPTPRIMIAILFLDDVHNCNGPLMLIPGSHQEGLIAKERDPERHKTYEDYDPWIDTVTSKTKFSLEEKTVKRLVSQYGTVTATGSAGSVLFMHPNCVHGSSTNIYPFDRNVVVIVYNSIENLPLPSDNPRPDFLATHHPVEVEPLAAMTS